jgi:hypothetical protein
VPPRHRFVPASEPGAAESCVITGDDRNRRRPDMSALFAQLAEQQQTARGNVFVFRGDPQVLWEQASLFVDEESACCPFFDYEITEEPDGVQLFVGTPAIPVEGP